MSTSTPSGVNCSAEKLVDHVREDPTLRREEKETTIWFAKDQDRATVFTAEAGLMRRLLQHPEFEVLDLVAESGSKVESVQQLHADEDSIVGVRGTIPIGALKVLARARSTSGHANIVSRAAGGGD